MENFEALGRYTAAKDKAEELLTRRYNSLKELAEIIKPLINGVGIVHFVSNFNHQRVAQLLEEAKECHLQMLESMQEANKYANIVDKLELKIIPEK